MKTINYHRKRLFFIPLIAIGIALFAYVTMLLWNALLPAIFNFSPITFWQALGLLVLARLLFGGHHPHRNPRWTMYGKDRELRNKLMKMSPEEKKEFFRKMHYDRTVWRHEHFKDEDSQIDKSTEQID